MSAPAPTLRQAVEGMALSFDAAAAAGQRAVIEFEAPGERPPVSHLAIADGACRFAPGPAPAPTLRLRTDGTTWARIGAGQLDFLAAAGAGAVEASGDLGQVLQLGRWFPGSGRAPLRAEAGRPPGPLRLPAMAWLAVAFVPWKAYLVAASLGGAPRTGAALGAGLALLLAGYRSRFGGSTFLERAGATALLALAVLGPAAAEGRAAAVGLALLGAIWGLGAARELPLTGEYARWRYLPALAGTTLFRHPNAAISLAWSAAFLVAALAVKARGLGLLGTAAVVALQIAAFGGAGLFTRAHEGGARARRIDDIDRRLAALRAAGLALAAAGAAVAALGA